MPSFQVDVFLLNVLSNGKDTNVPPRSIPIKQSIATISNSKFSSFSKELVNNKIYHKDISLSIPHIEFMYGARRKEKARVSWL